MELPRIGTPDIIRLFRNWGYREVPVEGPMHKLVHPDLPELYFYNELLVDRAALRIMIDRAGRTEEEFMALYREHF